MKSVVASISVLFTTILLLSSCESNDKRIIKMATDPKSLYNGQDSSKGLLLKIRYLPPELLALKESKELGSKEYLNFKKEFGNQLLFKVSFQWTNEQNFLEYDIKNEGEYYQRLNYFMTEAGSDFRLVCGKDTMNSIFCQIERTFKETPFITLLLAFEKPKKNTSVNIIYNAAIWSRSELKVEFNEEIISGNKI